MLDTVAMHIPIFLYSYSYKFSTSFSIARHLPMMVKLTPPTFLLYINLVDPENPMRIYFNESLNVFHKTQKQIDREGRRKVGIIKKNQLLLQQLIHGNGRRL